MKTGEKDKGINKGKKQKLGLTTKEKTPKGKAKDGNAVAALESQETQANFLEDDNYVNIRVSAEEIDEFPTTSDEDSGSNSSDEEGESHPSFNNNTTVAMPLSAVRSPRTWEQLLDRTKTEPNWTHENDGQLSQTLSTMQRFMLRKGIIKKRMNAQEFQKFLEEEEMEMDNIDNLNESMPEINSGETRKVPKQGKSSLKESSKSHCKSSSSEATIYQRAVPRIVPDMNYQIEQFIEGVRLEQSLGRKRSNSSEDTVMDTSDELDNNHMLNTSNIVQFGNLITDQELMTTDHVTPVRQGTGNPKLTQQEQVDQIIKDSGNSKARLYEAPGKVVILTSNNAIDMDLDYQMIDSHIDEILQKKIQCFKYVEFSKLITKSQSSEDQRLEIVNRTGLTYLSLVSDRETLQINSYARWEQAFRVYSNVLTARFPQKATELLQYNHTIHAASTTYAWDNIYAYDHEFRRHIGKHPTRS